MARKKSFDDVKLGQLLQLYGDGKEVSWLAAHFAVSVPTVYKALKESGVEMKGHRGPRTKVASAATVAKNALQDKAERGETITLEDVLGIVSASKPVKLRGFEIEEIRTALQNHKSVYKRHNAMDISLVYFYLFTIKGDATNGFFMDERSKEYLYFDENNSVFVHTHLYSGMHLNESMLTAWAEEWQKHGKV